MIPPKSARSCGKSVPSIQPSWTWILLCRLTAIVGFIAAALAASAADASALIAAAPAGEPLATNFVVTVNGSNVPVYLASVATASHALRKRVALRDDTSYRDYTAFISFDLTSNVLVTVTCAQPVKQARLLPVSAHLVPGISGKQITFTITKPGACVLDVNNDWVHSLQIFANPPEKDPPASPAPNVIYFGPGVHVIRDLQVTSGQTLYVAAGAVLYGEAPSQSHSGSVISLVGTNITLRGRGIIDGSRCPGHTRNLLTVCGRNISIEGVVLRDSSTWTMPIRESDGVTVDNLKVFGYRGNSDGIDICNSRNVRVRRCYLRTMDDLVVIKTPDEGGAASRNIEVTQCVLWNELAHALSLGAELRANVEHVTFSDCDVVHDKGREWLLRVYHCDSGEIRDVTFENIRIDETKRLASIWIGKTRWSKDADRGRVDNITFRNIEGVGPAQTVELAGFDAQHQVQDIHFEHVMMNGQPIRPADVKQNQFVQGVTVLP